MRRNYSKHSRKHADPYRGFDIQFVKLPQTPEISRIDVLPLKTIYYNRAAADGYFCCRVFKTVETFEKFCDRNGIDPLRFGEGF